MIGDLTIVPGTAAVDLAPSAPESPARPGAAQGRSLPSAAMGNSLPSASQERKLPPGAAAAAGAARLEADRLKALLTDARTRVTTYVDEDSRHLVMLVEDRATGAIVDQIPSEKLLRLFAALREPLVNEQA